MVINSCKNKMSILHKGHCNKAVSISHPFLLIFKAKEILLIAVIKESMGIEFPLFIVIDIHLVFAVINFGIFGMLILPQKIILSSIQTVQNTSFQERTHNNHRIEFLLSIHYPLADLGQFHLSLSPPIVKVCWSPDIHLFHHFHRASFIGLFALTSN